MASTNEDQTRESDDQVISTVPYTVRAPRRLEANGTNAAASNQTDRHVGTDSNGVVPNVLAATSDDQANGDGPAQRRRDQRYDPRNEDQVQERGPNGESTTSTDPYAVRAPSEGFTPSHDGDNSYSSSRQHIATGSLRLTNGSGPQNTWVPQNTSETSFFYPFRSPAEEAEAASLQRNPLRRVTLRRAEEARRRQRAREQERMPAGDDYGGDDNDLTGSTLRAPATQADDTN